MLKKAPYFIILMGLFVLAYSCSKKSKQELKKSKTFSQGKPIDYKIEENSKFATIEVYDKMNPFLDSIKGHYDSIKYFCDLDSNFLFYVYRGGKTGVVDKHDKIIVPVEYSKIYNPGGTVKGHIEVEKEGRRGLYDLRGSEVVSAKYQAIYPVNEEGVLVQVRLDSLLGIVKDNGEVVFDLEAGKLGKYSQSPFVNKDALQWTFNVNNENILFLQPVGFVRMGDDVIEGRGIVFTPSYLADLGFIPTVIEGVVMEKEADFGIAESKGKVSKVNTLWDGLWATFTEYFEVGLDARGYETNKNNLVTVNNRGEVMGSAPFFKPYMPSSPCGDNDDMFASQFVDSSLFEVKTYVYDYESLSADTTYNTFNEYHYFRIDSLGKIGVLKSNRRFSFTQFVKINKNYLQGCYAKFIDPEGEDNAITRRNLSAEDLEVMKNEIFADYGLIFKKGRWKNYFTAKKWYKGKHNDVNQFLTEIDKHNIAFINQMIDKMKARPDIYAKSDKGNIPIVP